MSTSCYLAIIILIALFATFIIQVAEKRNYRNYAIYKTEGPLRQMFECDFCLGFWISVVLSIITAIILKDWFILAAPVFSAPITRYFLN